MSILISILYSSISGHYFTNNINVMPLITMDSSSEDSEVDVHDGDGEWSEDDTL